MRQVPDVEVENRLEFDNSWWTEGAVDRRFWNWPRRDWFDAFLAHIDAEAPRRMVVLGGARRVGKTVMIHQAIQQLIDDGAEPTACLYLTLDSPLYAGRDADDLVALFRARFAHGPRRRLWIFVDAVHHLAGWPSRLAALAAANPGVRVVGATSMAPPADGPAAGDAVRFDLPPLTFAEFLRLRGLDGGLVDAGGAVRDGEGLNDAFIDYLNFGGFPETAMDQRLLGEMDRHVAADMVAKVVQGELPGLHGISDGRELIRLLAGLAYNTGREFTIHGLAQASRLSKNTLKRYLDFLEAAYLVRRLGRLDGHGRRFAKHNHFTVHLSTPCLRAALFTPLGASHPDLGRLAASALIGQVPRSAPGGRLAYARWKTGRLDLVLMDEADAPLLAMGVGWSDGSAAARLRQMRALAAFGAGAAPPLRRALATESRDAIHHVDGVEIALRPVAACCHAAGVGAAGAPSDGAHPLAGLAAPGVGA